MTHFGDFEQALRIENKVKVLQSVIAVKANYSKEIVNLVYDSTKTNEAQIVESIEFLGYKVKVDGHQSKYLHNLKEFPKLAQIFKLLGMAATIIVIFFLISNAVDVDISSLRPDMGYGILFVIGLVTSLHCITMCGGINLSLCMSYNTKNIDRFPKFYSSILYNVGRAISYTLIGDVVGTVGSIINISQGTRGVGAVISGSFMVLMGLTMLGLFPALRKLVPKMPKRFGNKLYDGVGKNSPIIIGLLGHVRQL